MSTITPEQFGLTRAPISAPSSVAIATTNATILRAIFSGQPGP